MESSIVSSSNLIRLGGLAAMVGGLAATTLGLLYLLEARGLGLDSTEKALQKGDYENPVATMLLVGVLVAIAALHLIQRQRYDRWVALTAVAAFSVPHGCDKRIERQETMRATSVMRFVLFGAVGFGVGPAMTANNPLLGYFAMGALGGVALGAALQNWRRTIILVLTGLIGFGIGFNVGFVLIYVWEPPLMLLVKGVVGGAVGGAVLGSVFRDWRTVAAMALSGAVGFGIGGGIVDLLRQPFISPGAGGVTFWWATGFMLIQGAIGGASLGAVLGYLESRKLVEERSPRVR